MGSLNLKWGRNSVYYSDGQVDRGVDYNGFRTIYDKQFTYFCMLNHLKVKSRDKCSLKEIQEMTWGWSKLPKVANISKKMER
jgi:hypothetical protein